jgi:hypothetical protein
LTTRIRSHVLEMPVGSDRRHDRVGPRDLLPWADPYIAGLIRRLEDRFEGTQDDAGDFYTAESYSTESYTAAGDFPGGLAGDERLAADDEAWNPAPFDDGWRDDAFMPRPIEASRFAWYPPIYGGFPLLNDRGESDHDHRF